MEHKYEIKYVGYVRTTDTFITVDSKGYLYEWEYDKAYYGVAIGGYKAKNKYRVLCNSNYYSRTQTDR